jgi:hypothetical protein
MAIIQSIQEMEIDASIDFVSYSIRIDSLLMIIASKRSTNQSKYILKPGVLFRMLFLLPIHMQLLARSSSNCIWRYLFRLDFNPK